MSDITYVGTLEGWLYLAVILDLFSRKVVGWKLGETLQAELVVAALKNALVLRQPEPGLYFHSDQGSQYSSDAVRKPLTVIGANLSMSAPGNCYENAKAEAFFSTLKGECFPEQSSVWLPRRKLVAKSSNTSRPITTICVYTARWVTRHPCQYETKFSRVIDSAIDAQPKVSMPHRRIELCGDATRAPMRPCKRQVWPLPGGTPAWPILPEQAQSEKSQGVRGTESPDSFNNTLKKTENYVSVFSGEVQSMSSICAGPIT